MTENAFSFHMDRLKIICHASNHISQTDPTHQQINFSHEKPSSQLFLFNNSNRHLRSLHCYCYPIVRCFGICLSFASLAGAIMLSISSILAWRQVASLAKVMLTQCLFRGWSMFAASARHEKSLSHDKTMRQVHEHLYRENSWSFPYISSLWSWAGIGMPTWNSC